MDLIYLIIGMALVTYLPRVLPLVLFKNLSLAPYLKVFMRLVPYAALGALIIPGPFNTVSSQMFPTFIGFLAAIALAYYEYNLILIVAGSIFSSLVANLILT
ncbi:MAG TPA: AzlD domain-containing protein [Candidatus Avacidaminococcus intestinavium]|uniref:AzlD domain-containing protein n=1 Tax=Candidatus Avacidaminococcus intestinavium TaxID=2840684 RepID=A0A9D1MNZ5_9FIRM|nr:AzlD domain-containing protein [Candidatus Avacidaminococcus intestinavium]